MTLDKDLSHLGIIPITTTLFGVQYLWISMFTKAKYFAKQLQNQSSKELLKDNFTSLFDLFKTLWAEAAYSSTGFWISKLEEKSDGIEFILSLTWVLYI